MELESGSCFIFEAFARDCNSIVVSVAAAVSPVGTESDTGYVVAVIRQFTGDFFQQFFQNMSIGRAQDTISATDQIPGTGDISVAAAADACYMAIAAASDAANMVVAFVSDAADIVIAIAGSCADSDAAQVSISAGDALDLISSTVGNSFNIGAS